jgi:hypothetical protein
MYSEDDCRSSLWDRPPTYASNSLASAFSFTGGSRIATLSIRDGRVVRVLHQPGSATIGSDDFATLTEFGLTPWRSGQFPDGDHVADPNVYSALASLTSAPASTGNVSNRTRSILTDPSLSGIKIVLDTGTAREMHFSAESTALAVFTNEQAQYEDQLRDAIKLSVVETLSDDPNLKAVRTKDVRDAYSNLINHQDRWHFKESSEENKLQDSAALPYGSSIQLYESRDGKTEMDWPEFKYANRTSLYTPRSLASPASNVDRNPPDNFWPNVIMMVFMVCKWGRESMPASGRKTLSQLLAIGQELKRISMIGYNDRFDPIYDPRG